MTDPLHFTDPDWSVQEARRQAIDEAADLCTKWGRLLDEIAKANKMAESNGGLPVSPGTEAQAEMAHSLARMIRKLPIKAPEEQRKNIETDGAEPDKAKVRHINPAPEPPKVRTP